MSARLIRRDRSSPAMVEEMLLLHLVAPPFHVRSISSEHAVPTPSSESNSGPRFAMAYRPFFANTLTT